MSGHSPPRLAATAEERAERFRTLVRRAVTIDDPFAPHVTVKSVLAALEMVRESKGDGEADRLVENVWQDHVRAAGIPKAQLSAALQDQHGFMHGILASSFLFRAYLLLRREDFFMQIGFRVVSDRSNVHTAFAGPLGLYWLYRHVAEVARNFSSTLSVEFDAKRSRDGRAVVRCAFKDWTRQLVEVACAPYPAEITRLWCHFTQGGLAAVPVLLGRPAAAVTHPHCEAEGAAACEYVVEWAPASLWERVSTALLAMSKRHRELLAKLGQVEVVIRDRTAALEEAHRRALQQQRDIAEARAQLQMGKAYAASAAHDINNALGPARSGIESILEILREAKPLPYEPASAEEAAEADFARRLGLVIDEKLGEVVSAFENVMDQLPKEEAEALLNALEYLARVARTVQTGIPDIYRGINRAAEFTAFMNELSKVDYAEKEKPLRLDELLKETVSKYEKLWERRGIQIESRIEPDMAVMGWPLVFQSVFSNLLDNAAQAVANSGQKTVQVIATRDGARCQVRVSDTGCGIPRELHERIFDLGYTTRPAGGKGFGLAYVRNYVRLLGGTIRVESQPGSGASFELTFPTAMEEVR